MEAKSLVVYPMLIAQFIGIVHELKPTFLKGDVPDELEKLLHFEPSLVSLGYLHNTCLNIVKGLDARNIRIGIVAKFDHVLSRLGDGMTTSPLARTPPVSPDDPDEIPQRRARRRDGFCRPRRPRGFVKPQALIAGGTRSDGQADPCHR